MTVDRRTIKIAVDTHHLYLENAGTKRVTLNLIEQFKKRTDINFIEIRPPYSLKKGPGFLNKVWAHSIRFFWVHIHLPILCYLKKANVLLSPEFNTPFYTPCIKAVIAHDAHMRAQREFTSSLWFYGYYIPFIEKAIQRADLVFTVSEFAKKQVVSLMNVPSKKVSVVYNGLDKIFLDEANSAACNDIVQAKGLEWKDYVLFVGTFEARKNIERLIEAFGILKRDPLKFKTLKLAIIGNPSSARFSDRSTHIATLLKSAGVEHVVMCGYVSDKELPALYTGAAVIAFPSLQEGFGLPIIEGFASNTPVLTSNVCSMPEVAGDAAILVNPYDINDMSEKLELLLTDKDLSDKMIAAGKNRLKYFTWESSANQIIDKILNYKEKGNADC